MILRTIDIEPTTICDLQCPFCFGPKIAPRKTEVKFDIWKTAMLKFKEYGAKNIVISGGEPLLYNHILELVMYLKGLDYNIVLSTHGRNKMKLIDIAAYCDWVSLPIDAITEEMTTIMRTDNYSVNNIIDTAKALKMKYSNIKIKIGTVITKKNIDEIYSIKKILDENLDAFDTWKLYQYTPRRKHKHLKNDLLVSDDEYLRLCLNIVESNTNRSRIVYSSNLSRQNAYTFIYHDGEVNLVNCGPDFGDIKAGNINELDQINFRLIEESLSKNHGLNFNNTY